MASMNRSPFKKLQKGAGFAWNPQLLRHSAEDVFRMQSSVCTVNFTNVSRSDWTWGNLWNFLTINFRYKYFHNFGQGFICKCIYFPRLAKWKIITEKCIGENSPALDMTWSLIPHVGQPHNKLPPICHEKLLEKGPSILYTRTLMPLLHWKIRWGYMLPQYLQGSAD